MAGGFGFESGEHYDVSVACGEQKLLPAVRAAPKDALVIADGFSCREQIAQTTDRRALHLAEVLDLASRADGGGLGAYPERRVAPEGGEESAWLRPAAFAAGAGAAGALAWLLVGRKPSRWER
jgi:hypothetical protein